MPTSTSVSGIPQSHPEVSGIGVPTEKLLQDRLQRFILLLSKVLSQDSVDAVHDLRVWSRRLQQVISTISVHSSSPEVRLMVRALRRARRAVGGWRDCDVLLDLLERKARRVRNPGQKVAYEMVRHLALDKRKQEICRARSKLANRKLFSLAHRAQNLLHDLSQNEEQAAEEVTSRSIAEGYAEWRQALSCACESYETARIHAFRVRTKQLRYRIELARDLGDGGAELALKSLRSLQDVFGSWHDNIQMMRLAAEALADSEFLLKHPTSAALLLRKLDRDQLIQSQRVQWLLQTNNDNIDASALSDWIIGYCRKMTTQPPGEANGKPPEPGISPNDLVRSQHKSAGAVATVEARVGADDPIEDFVKTMGELPT